MSPDAPLSLRTEHNCPCRGAKILNEGFAGEGSSRSIPQFDWRGYTDTKVFGSLLPIRYQPLFQARRVHAGSIGRTRCFTNVRNGWKAVERGGIMRFERRPHV